MATYYIDPLGTDDGSHGTGTGTDAWLTLDYALRSGGLQDGDVLEMAAGTYSAYYSTNTYLDARNITGTVTVRPAEGATVTLDYPTNTNGYFFRLAPTLGDLLILDGINITNSNNIAAGLVWSLDDSRIRFNDCNIDTGVISSIILQGGPGFDGKIEFIGGTVASKTTGRFLDLYSTSGGEYVFSGVEFTEDFAARMINIQPTASNFSLTIEDCVAGKDGNDPFMIVQASAGAFSIQRNKFSLNGGNTYGFVWFIDESGNHWHDNPDTVVFENNVIWDATDTIENNVFLNPGTWIPSQTNYYLDPSTATAALVIAGGTPSKALTDRVGAVGDSISNGSGATSGNMWFDKFKDMTGITVSRTSGETTIPGLRLLGALYCVDKLFTLHAPQSVCIICGINDINDQTEGQPYDEDITDAQMAARLEAVGRKIERWGAVPFFMLPITRVGGDGTTTPPDNTYVEGFNAAAADVCLANGWEYMDLNAKFKENANWFKDAANGGYFADLSSDLHPNNDGHAIIGEWAVYRWLDTDPGGCVPVICRPIECKQTMCRKVRCR